MGNDDEKTKQISWTHALREIVINCYKFHGRDDLLPKFTEEEDMKRVQTVRKVGGSYGTSTVVQTISNPDGTVSIIHVDPSNPVITHWQRWRQALRTNSTLRKFRQMNMGRS